MSDGIFQLDTRTLASMEDLRSKLRTRSNTEVIQNALALLKLAIENADPDSLVITIQSREGSWLKVDLRTSA